MSTSSSISGFSITSAPANFLTTLISSFTTSVNVTTTAISNTTNSTSEEDHEGILHKVTHMIDLVVWPMLAFTGLFLNTLCFLTLRKRAARPPLINFFLCALAILDNTNLSFYMIATWAHHVTDDTFNVYERGCAVFLALWFTVGDASSFVLAILSLDRFFNVFFSDKVRGLSSMRTAWTVISLVLLVTFFGLNFQFLFTVQNIGDRNDFAYEYLCPAQTGHDYWLYKVVPWFLDHVLYFYIPAVVIVFCNVALIVKMKRHQKAVGMTLGKSNKKQESDQALRRSNKVLFLVSGYFIVVMAPYLTFQSFYGQFFGNAEPKRKAQGDLAYAFFTLLHTSNYCFNFFFYYYASSVFRKDFKGLFARCRRQHIEEHTTSGKDMEESVTRVQKIKAKNETLTSVGENSTN